MCLVIPLIFVGGASITNDLHKFRMLSSNAPGYLLFDVWMLYRNWEAVLSEQHFSKKLSQAI